MITKILLSLALFLFVRLSLAEDLEKYDRVTGNKVDDEKLKEYKSRNVSRVCSIKVAPCKPHTFRRVDGTCSNFKYPSKGSAFTPYLRLLDPLYEKDGSIRKSKSGDDLPLARKIRTTLLNDGRVLNSKLNTAVVHVLGFHTNDMTSPSGKFDFVKERQYCCSHQGKVDPKCLPINVPSDDPYLGITDIRCLNFSRAQTFQDIGCIVNRTNPEQINLQTPLFDLSIIYGADEDSHAKIRTNKSGLLLMEERKGRLLPLGDSDKSICIGNEANETICYRFGDSSLGNLDLRSTATALMFMKEHNRLAKDLLELNPCWSDERTFQIARQINIATASNIVMYELYPLLLGRNNMLEYGLIHRYYGYVNDYDPQLEPNIYAEFEIAMKYFHTLVDGRIQKYDKFYKKTEDLSISSTMFRTDLLEQGDKLEEINRGTFYQKMSASDDNVDVEISERLFSKFQKANDLFSIDIQRGRDMGLRSYNDYRHYCGLPKAKTFEDFADVITNDKVDTLRLLYKDVDDVDLLAGIASEIFIPGGLVGPTLYCIIAKQLLNNRLSDRYWFERNDHYFSFTRDQLDEIRKTNIARLACDNADGIEYMQPAGFLVPSHGNEMVPCKHITRMDLRKWTDPECRAPDQKDDEVESFNHDDDFPFSFLKF